MTSDDLRIRFLEDGGQAAADVARDLVAFIAGATRSLDVAIYDFHAREGASAALADALEAAHERGVRVRVAFNVERLERAAAPRPMTEDPAVIDGLDVPTRGVQTQGALMHHKYAVADGERVLTGSTNWTDDAFSREENALVTVESSALATAYTENFEELWRRGRVERSGSTGEEVSLSRGVRMRPWFLPSPPSVAHLVADRIGAAERRLRVCSPVITSGPVLGTVAEFAGRLQFDLSGAYDRTQMEEVQRQWAGVAWNRWKIAAWQAIAPRLSGKVSTPYGPGTVHDYMHAKFVVADDEVLAGSYNLSKGGEDNGENVLHVVSEGVAERFTAFADRIAERYRTSDTVGSSATGQIAERGHHPQ